MQITPGNQGFIDIAFDAAEELIAQGCAIHMLLAHGGRVAYWIPDPMLPAGAFGVLGLWGLNGKWEAFTRGRRKSVSVRLPLGQHRAWVVQACATGANATAWDSFWATWRESDCVDLQYSCERSREVSFTVTLAPGRSSPRVELSFPGSLAVIKQGDPLLIQVALWGLLPSEQFDERCAVQLNLDQFIFQPPGTPAGGNSFSTPPHQEVGTLLTLPCGDFERVGRPGSEAKLVGKSYLNVILPAAVVAQFLRPGRAGAKFRQGHVLFDVSVVSKRGEVLRVYICSYILYTLYICICIYDMDVYI